MSWRAVARKDVRDALRARSVWLLTGLFLVVFLGLTYVVPKLGEESFDSFLAFSRVVVGVLLPLVAVVLGYKAVITERESGTAALLLSLPHSRRDVVIGKFVGRSIVLAVPTALGLVVAAPLAATQFVGFDAGTYLGFAIATVVYGCSFLGIAIGLSTASTSARRVTAGAFGAYVVFVLFWTTLVDVVAMVLFRFRGDELVDPPTWVPLAKLLDPHTAYAFLLSDGLDTGLDAPVGSLGENWVTSPSVAALLLLAWIVVPLAVGYARFERTDL